MIAPLFLFLFLLHPFLLANVATLVLEDKFLDDAEYIVVITAEFIIFYH